MRRQLVLARGRRTAFTSGTPASLTEDRHAGFLPADTAMVKALAAAIRQRRHA